MKNIERAFSTKIFYSEIKPIINCFRLLGVTFLNDDFKTLTKIKRRFLHFYINTFLLVMTILAIVLVKEHVDIIRFGDITYNDYIFFYGTTFFHLSCLFLPFITLFEKKKITNYFRLWKHFEYFILLKKEPIINIRPRLSLKVSIILIFTGASACTFLILIYSSRAYFYSNIFLYYVYSIMTVYHSVLATVYAVFWFFSTKALKLTARNFLLEVKACKDDHDKLENFRCIWVILKDLALGLGNSFSSTFMWVLTFTSILELSAAYFCIYRTALGYFSKGWIPTVFTALYLNLFGQCAHEAVEEVGDKFKRLIFNMLSTERNQERREELKCFINTMCASPPRISMSGSMTLNRKFNLGMINTLIAYMIVFFQFKMMEDAKAKSNCSA